MGVIVVAPMVNGLPLKAALDDVNIKGDKP
jgi:hypothetical protein